MITYIPRLNISPNSSVLYLEYFNTEGNFRRLNNNSFANLATTTTNGIISNKAGKLLKNKINWLCYLAKEKIGVSKKTGKEFTFRMGMTTLTLPAKQEHKDEIIKRECLNNFLIECKRKFNLKTYIWRAEAQNNGNIHFHIIHTQFLPYQQVQQIWNKCIEKLNYVSRFGKHINPPTCKTHSIQNLRSIGKYLSKYATKNDLTRRKIEGKLWDTSKNLTMIDKIKAEISDTEYNYLIELCNAGKIENYEVERCRLISVDVSKLFQIMPSLKKYFNSWLLNCLNLAREKLKKVKTKIIEICQTQLSPPLLQQFQQLLLI